MSCEKVVNENCLGPMWVTVGRWKSPKGGSELSCTNCDEMFTVQPSFSSSYDGGGGKTQG